MLKGFNISDYILNLDTAKLDTNKKYYIMRSRTVGKKESIKRLLEYVKKYKEQKDER